MTLNKHRGKKYKKCKSCKKYKKHFEFYSFLQPGKSRNRTFFTTCKSCDNIRSKRWGRKNKELRYIYSLVYKFGITKEQYFKLKEKQNNKCAICNKSPTKQRLHLDHCHKTLKIRGLLCNNCNRGIGHLKEDIDILKKAIQYIKK